MTGSARSSSSPAAATRARRAAVHALPVQFADDAALALAAAQRHPAAARTVWTRFSTLVRGLLRRMLGAHGEVEDHVQEVFLRFFKEVPKLRDPSKLRSFIVGISMRVARSEIRRRRVRGWLRLSDSATMPERAHEPRDYAAAEALAHLQQILERLDPSTREVFVLRRVEGLQLSEIGEALGCSLATVKRRLKRASAVIMATVERDPALRDYVVNRGRKP